MRRPTICVDFDGVIHSYSSGWKGIANIPDRPMPGAIAWLKEVLDCPDSICSMALPSKVEIVIYSSRSRSWQGRRAMKKWFARYMGREYLEVLRFPRKKPAAFLTIDDRAFCFRGRFPTVDEMVAFVPWKPQHKGGE